jgi:hypothetical protein
MEDSAVVKVQQSNEELKDEATLLNTLRHIVTQELHALLSHPSVPECFKAVFNERI